MTAALAILAPWFTLGNIFAVIGLAIFVGRKLSSFDRLIHDQSAAEARADLHSDEIGTNERRIAVLEALAERSKDLPERIAHLTALIEGMGARG